MRYILALIFGAMFFALGWFWRDVRQVTSPITHTDTVTVVRIDTLRIAQPRLVDSVVLRHRYVTHHLTDTEYVTAIRDSVVYLAVEQRHYADTLYDAWVSGHAPALDSIHVYPRTVERTVTIDRILPSKQRRWAVTAGVGAVASPQGIAPGVYVGVGYIITR